MNVLKSLLNLRPFEVSAGPFKSTKCRFTSSGDGVVAKLAGTYECELHEAFASVISRQPELVVDVGAAEGFYVAALARAIPGARVIAYEAKESWHPRLLENLLLNGVEDQCEVRGLCDMDEFRALTQSSGGERMFLMMDIEGAEFELLDDEALLCLAQAELLVELHEPESREAGDKLIAKLGGSHDVKVLWQKPRDANDIQSPAWRTAAKFLPPLKSRLDEGRVYEMRWIWGQPKVVAPDMPPPAGSMADYRFKG